MWKLNAGHQLIHFPAPSANPLLFRSSSLAFPSSFVIPNPLFLYFSFFLDPFGVYFALSKELPRSSFQLCYSHGITAWTVYLEAGEARGALVRMIA